MSGTGTLPKRVDDIRQDPEWAVSITGLVKTFGPTRALRGVDLHVARGECHALLGRNGAGKSTLIGILTGLVKADEGTIDVSGAAAVDGTADVAMENIVACVYQKSTLVPDLTVAENITLGAYPCNKLGAVDWRKINRTATALLDEWGHGALAGRLVSDLEPIERKIVEVCRALSRGPRVLLLDEPTAGLDGGSVEELFHQIDKLKAAGVTIIYVSHHLEEIFQICDRVTILRDGKDVLSKSVSDLDMDELITTMTGGEASATASAIAGSGADLGDDQLIISDLEVGERVSNFALTVRAGECVGLTGLDGAGHVQVAEAIAGQAAHTAGTIEHRGSRLPSGRPLAAIKCGIGFVPEDRHVNGYVPQLSVEENATLTVLHRIRNKVGFVDRRSRRKAFQRQSSTWTIVCSGPTQSIEELSGGNQQKVVLARALASDPDTIVVVNPTAGVDIAAKNSIYATLGELAGQGKSVIVVSSDDDDLRICDRVIAMVKGRVSAELGRGFSEDDLVRAIQGADAPTLDDNPHHHQEH